MNYASTPSTTVLDLDKLFHAAIEPSDALDPDELCKIAGRFRVLLTPSPEDPTRMNVTYYDPNKIDGPLCDFDRAELNQLAMTPTPPNLTNRPVDGRRLALLVQEIAEIIEELPAYTRPGYFIPLDSFPPGPNSKLATDRLCNPIVNPYQRQPIIGSTTVQQVCKLWAGYFGSHVTLDQNSIFKNLGGDSLLVINMLSKVNIQFGISINMPHFWNNQTVARLATLIDAARPIKKNEAHEYWNHSNQRSTTPTRALRLRSPTSPAATNREETEKVVEKKEFNGGDLISKM